MPNTTRLLFCRKLCKKYEIPCTGIDGVLATFEFSAHAHNRIKCRILLICYSQATWQLFLIMTIVIVIVIFNQGVHSVKTDFQWSPGQTYNNNTYTTNKLFCYFLCCSSGINVSFRLRAPHSICQI